MPDLSCCPAQSFCANLFVLNIPVCCGKTSDGWRLTSSTGISPLRGSLRAAPTCCDGSRRPFAVSRSTLWPDRSIAPLPVTAMPGAARHLGLSVSRSAPASSRPKTFLSIGGVFSVSCPVHPGAEAHVAYAPHINNGNVPDEWLFSCQGTGPAPLGSREQAGPINPFTYYLTQRPKCNPLSEKIFLSAVPALSAGLSQLSFVHNRAGWRGLHRTPSPIT